MKSLVAVLSVALSLFLGVCAEVHAQEPSPTISAPAPSIPPNADPATATRAWLDTVPAEKRAKSDAYFEGGYWLILWNFLMTAAISIFLLASRISARMRDFAERVSFNAVQLVPAGIRGFVQWVFLKSLQVFLYVIPFVLLTSLLGFPLHYYENFVREHAYGLATQNFGQWFREQLIGLTAQLVVTSVLLMGLYFAFRRAPRTWWIWGTILSIIFFMAGLMLSPVYIEPLFNTYKPLNDPAISEPILAMARANEIPVTQVFEVDASRQSNRVSANVAGFLGTTRIALNDNLLKQCTLPEIREVMAHEMGHYILNHSVKLVMYFGLFFLIGFAVAKACFDTAVRRWGDSWGLRLDPAASDPFPDGGTTPPSETAKVIAQPSAVYGIADPAGLPLLSLIFAAVFFLLTPLSNTVVRVTEREADAFSINTSREPDGMAKVALKLGSYRKLDPTPLEEFIFFDHPSGRARIRMAMDWKAAHLPAGGSE